MNVSKHIELTDKYMEFLAGIFDDHKIETADPAEFMNRCGNLICAAVEEAMETQGRMYRFEVGELTGSEMLLNDPTAPKHFYWNMIAGFTTLEDAEAYSASRKEYTKVFIDGIPTGLNE